MTIDTVEWQMSGQRSIRGPVLLIVQATIHAIATNRVRAMLPSELLFLTWLEMTVTTVYYFKVLRSQRLWLLIDAAGNDSILQKMF